MNWDGFWLTDEQFAKIKPHLPTDTRGKPRVDDRRVISGIIHVLKSGRALGGCAPLASGFKCADAEQEGLAHAMVMLGRAVPVEHSYWRDGPFGDDPPLLRSRRTRHGSQRTGGGRDRHKILNHFGSAFDIREKRPGEATTLGACGECDQEGTCAASWNT